MWSGVPRNFGAPPAFLAAGTALHSLHSWRYLSKLKELDHLPADDPGRVLGPVSNRLRKAQGLRNGPVRAVRGREDRRPAFIRVLSDCTSATGDAKMDLIDEKLRQSTGEMDMGFRLGTYVLRGTSLSINVLAFSVSPAPVRASRYLSRTSSIETASAVNLNVW